VEGEEKNSEHRPSHITGPAASGISSRVERVSYVIAESRCPMRNRKKAVAKHVEAGTKRKGKDVGGVGCGHQGCELSRQRSGSAWPVHSRLDQPQLDNILIPFSSILGLAGSTLDNLLLPSHPACCFMKREITNR